ncbi:MAG: hypothetical protein KKE30_15795 [Gammaproteobacteria bacterium]|nr:hypothetical protein [Gammaproteobacteria bacterium]MBU1556479.1 hypothetical protein [Gammaproteobacteria bacterium]MBU2070915.1 hypothetical protein [Gammaproteobacteria bacterium]MBU2183431.1 hypothetical protein [Gammaproteobacteria bacterium]MBU2204121.1 hypothetical protein [Gammaproteobacteria bacterium]
MLANRQELNVNYEQSLFSAFTNYQFVESLLRDYIVTAYEIIKIRVSCSNVMAFELSKKDIETFGLDRLNTTFKKLCRNKALSTAIKEVSQIRNELAHEAFFQKFKDRISEVSDEQIFEKTCKFLDCRSKLEPIITKLLRELKLIQAELESLSG